MLIIYQLQHYILEKQYIVDCNGRTFEDSVAYCESIGYQIASFHSDDDINKVKNGNDFTRTTCHGQPWSQYGGSTGGLYIGATSDANGNWEWLDGSDWWLYSQNDGLRGVHETKAVWWGGDGKWHDWRHGEVLHGVICQRPSGKTVY